VTPRIGVVVVAAGSGTRLGADRPKAFVRLRGKTLLERALRGVAGSSEPAAIVVVAPGSHLDDAAEQIRLSGLTPDEASVVAGGPSRQASVTAGLAALPDGVEIVLVHDAARALAPGALFDRVVARVRQSDAGVIPALPVTDTIKSLAPDGTVLATVDRDALGAVQTPQGFPLGALRAAYAAAGAEHTDDAALFAAAGHRVVVVAGEADAFKITTPWDLRRAEGMIGEPPALRSGIGVDVHAYDPAAPLRLGGLDWPGEPGLAGHSDGDALIHAICDALLSAGGLGDLGSRFGSADPRYAGADSAVFLDETLRLLASSGLRAVHVAVQVIGARPRIGGRREELQAHVTALVGAPVSIGATTTDGLGFAGRGEGLTVIASALVGEAPDGAGTPVGADVAGS
jgi:2-C-methyl-D-erythritol 4-phosphate cytidylyltransferase / 2-C-methyl-D-erythritol 2,4-cyclodiphosphate synthase